MGDVHRTRDAVDAVEHALQGVHTSDDHGRIISFERRPGLIGRRSVVQVDVIDDSPEEREVIVHLAAHPRRRAR